MKTYMKYLTERNSIFFNKTTSNMAKVLKSTFPDYKGRKFTVVINDFLSQLDSYWVEGTRTYYKFYDINTGKTFDVGSNHPMFEPSKPRYLSNPLPGVILVSHTIFQGKDIGINFYVMQQDYEWLAGVPQLLEPDSLTLNHKIVLYFTRAYKNFYAGNKENRFKEAQYKTKISWNDWTEAKNWLMKNGYLNSAGAITTKGKNIINDIRGTYDLK